MYWVYLNGYQKRVGLGWGAPRGVAPLLWLSVGSRNSGSPEYIYAIIIFTKTVCRKNRPGLHKQLAKAYVREVLSA